MDEYPYGRKGYPHCFYQDTATKSEFESSTRTGDNEMTIEGDIVYLYEAPTDDDKGRGHYSIWRHVDADEYEKVGAISGDDGMCYEKYESQDSL